MSEVSEILSRIEAGDPSAAESLLPLVYNELRKLAAVRLAREDPGQTLQATALVHEAYVRLVDVERVQRWNSRGHFFAAAAEAMRRILVERARAKCSLKYGGAFRRVALEGVATVAEEHGQDIVEISDLLDQLAAVDSQAAELVKLRFFAGLTGDQCSEILGVSPRTVDNLWKYAKAWLYDKANPRLD